MGRKTYVAVTLIFVILSMVGSRVLDEWTRKLDVMEEILEIIALQRYEQYHDEMSRFNKDLNTYLEKREVVGEATLMPDLMGFDDSVASNFNQMIMTFSRINDRWHYAEETDVLRRTGEVITLIGDDGNMTPLELKYINTLKEYTDIRMKDFEPLEEMKNDLMKQNDHQMKKVSVLMERIAESGEDTMKDEHFAFLKTFEGDFSGMDFNAAKKRADEAISWITDDVDLGYDNRDEVGQRNYFFRNYEFDATDFISPNILDDSVKYEVQIDKVDGSIHVAAVGYTYSEKNKTLVDAELDRIAQGVALKVNGQSDAISRKVEKPDVKNKRFTVMYTFSGGLTVRVEHFGLVTEVNVGE